jgi:hypothetical protein
MHNYGRYPDDPTIARLRQCKPAVNKFVGRWYQTGLSNKFEQGNFSEQHRISTSNEQIVKSQIHQFIDQVMRYFLKRSIFADKGIDAKLAPRWGGPFKVSKTVGSFGPAYKIHMLQVVRSMRPTFQVSALLPYNRSGPYQLPPLI